MKVLGVVIALFVTVAAPGLAGPVVSMTPGLIGTAPFSLGFEFNVLTPVTVERLGTFDDGSGLATSHEVGIFDSSETLLFSTTVVPTDPLIGLFRYHAISPAVLPVATGYRIAAETSGDSYTSFVGAFTIDPSIQFVTGRSLASGSLVFPTTNESALNPCCFGPNFYIGDVPEPGAGFLCAAGLLWLSTLALRRR